VSPAPVSGKQDCWKAGDHRRKENTGLIKRGVKYFPPFVVMRNGGGSRANHPEISDFIGRPASLPREKVSGDVEQ
jgi:hypothetical protein